MISVAAIRMQQFGVQFYQASLTAKDIDKLVRFEVLSYIDQTHAPMRGGRKGPYASVNRHKFSSGSTIGRGTSASSRTSSSKW